MKRLINISKKIFSNKAILYVISRYATYIIQFINSLFIAIYLGPFYLGIWGFISLVIGYISQLNFGISNSVNVIISVNKQDNTYVQKIVGNGLSMIMGLSFLVMLFFVMSNAANLHIGDKYHFNDYIVPICIIAVLTHLNGYFATILRVYGKIFAIAINQSLYPVLVLFIIPFFRGENLLWAMVTINCVSFLANSILFYIQRPFSFKPLFEWDTVKYIQRRGWHLFVYNASFYLILLTTRSFISGNYSVEEFGYFTFSYSLANAVLLLLDSISFLIFPKMLNRFALSDNEHSLEILKTVRSAYISLSHLLIHLVIMVFPLFIYFFPDYQQASSVFKITALTVVLYTNSFGYQGLLMARGYEKNIGIIAFCALILNIMLSAILVSVVKVTFEYVIVATLTTYLIYVVTLGVYGRKVLRLANNFTDITKDIYLWRMMIPFLISFLMIIFTVPDIYFIIPFLLYLFLNFEDILNTKDVILKVIENPNFIDI
ncbi:MAG: oligosaccharide flippase family protein [Bacteroidota bacterium]